MAKRVSSADSSCHPEEVPKKKPCLVQSSLFKFYKYQQGTGPGRATMDRPTTLGIVPVSLSTFNIRLYSESEIENATGLNKQRLKFWNDKAIELCSDKSITDHLYNNREAIEGAIHSSWVMNKTSILELKAEEMEEKAKACYEDEVVREEILKGVKRNVLRMKDAHASVCGLYNILASSSGTERDQLELQLTEDVSELKKAQDALSKALQRSRLADITTKDQAMAAHSPVQLSDDEYSALITAVKNDYASESGEEQL